MSLSSKYEDVIAAKIEAMQKELEERKEMTATMPRALARFGVTVTDRDFILQSGNLNSTFKTADELFDAIVLLIVRAKFLK